MPHMVCLAVQCRDTTGGTNHITVNNRSRGCVSGGTCPVGRDGGSRCDTATLELPIPFLCSKSIIYHQTYVLVLYIGPTIMTIIIERCTFMAGRTVRAVRSLQLCSYPKKEVEPGVVRSQASDRTHSLRAAAPPSSTPLSSHPPCSSPCSSLLKHGRSRPPSRSGEQGQRCCCRR